jgi:cytochrome c oxidase assembly factor CtaG
VSPVAQAVLASWSVSPGLVLLLAVVAIVYVRGARRLPAHVPGWRIAAFLGGLAMLLVAVASPLDAFAALLLQAHMVQHLLLTMVVPPLLLLGAPAMPLLRGLPPRVAREALGPFLAWPALARLGAWLVHPAVAWLLFVGVGWAWHVPAAYELALRSPGWHAVEHACFLGTALLFWWPVVQPWPSRPWWPRWAMLPYLVLADVQNTVLAAFLVFAERVVYPHYATAPRLGGLTALDDQVAAGAIMWVPGSVAFLLPAALILWRQLSPAPVTAPRAHVRPAPAASFDLLAVPILRAVGTRRTAQALLLVVALAIVADGLLGPSMSPMNLAGVLPWTYWRGATVIVLLAAGNWLCFACPFTLPRALARRLGGVRRPWPRRARTKWIAVALLVAFFTGYELFAPWDSPWWTAWIVVAYFAVAFAVDARWERGSFCRWVCPVGQFQFVQSLVSPVEVRVRRPSACATCTTHDCLRACDADLFLPTKRGNLDCTFCLDCVRACPHDNVGVLATPPAAALAAPGPRLLRADTIGLVLVLVAAAFATAAAMVRPALGAALMLLGALPFVARRLGEERRRLALALVPLGAAMWAAHFGFHLLAGLASAVPVLQRALGLGVPDWSASAAMTIDGGTLLRLELLLLDAGLLLTLGLAARIARRVRPGGAFGVAAPWATVAVLLWLGGVWTFLQPMAMRGTMMGMAH